MNLNSDKKILHKHTPFTIWLFKDGKRGHENQTDGLVAALNRGTQNKVYTVSISDGFIISLLKFKWVLPWSFRQLPKSDLIIGTGHKTHLWMLLARLFNGGKVIVLMMPSLPTYLFDLICAPSHDKVAEKANVIKTKGALNTCQFSQDSILNRGLILLGGLSKHYTWSNESVLEQIKQLLENNPDILWELTTSRRTPPEMLHMLSQFSSNNLKCTPFEDTDKNWLSDRLKIASRVWVTQDSVSMIYEGLTAGSEVGLIRLKETKKNNRIVESINQLIEDSIVLTQVKLDINHLKSTSQFNEAERCAEEIFERFGKTPLTND